MKFSHLILAKTGFTFRKYNLHIIEQRDDYLKLQSEYLVIIIAHNQFENSNILWLGNNDEKIDKIEIDNEVLRLFFNSDLRLSHVPVETFVSNLVSFFENEAQPLLQGDVDKINELEKFDLVRNQAYTQNLLAEQNLAAANKAWDMGNYKEFVKLIGQIEKDRLPFHYQLKYKFAIQKLKNPE